MIAAKAGTNVPKCDRRAFKAIMKGLLEDKSKPFLSIMLCFLDEVIKDPERFKIDYQKQFKQLEVEFDECTLFWKYFIH